MSRLIENLLTLARADGGVRLRREPVDLAAVAEPVCRQASALHPTRRIGFAATPARAVAGDADLLTQLLWILLDNAVKFTADDGQIWVAVTQRGRPGAAHRRRQRHRPAARLGAAHLRPVLPGRPVPQRRRRRAGPGDRGLDRARARRRRSWRRTTTAAERPSRSTSPPPPSPRADRSVQRSEWSVATGPFSARGAALRPVRSALRGGALRPVRSALRGGALRPVRSSGGAGGGRQAGDRDRTASGRCRAAGDHLGEGSHRHPAAGVGRDLHR